MIRREEGVSSVRSVAYQKKKKWFGYKKAGNRGEAMGGGHCHKEITPLASIRLYYR